MGRAPSSSESSSDENDSESNEDPTDDDQTENTASRNEASASNASGSGDQHTEQTPRDIDMGKEKRLKLQNLNPEVCFIFNYKSAWCRLIYYYKKNVSTKV